LKAILQHSDRYGLKWVFLKDPYYEPLLVFSGWRKVDDLENKTITIWSKESVPPATPIDSPQRPAPWEGLLWGILPIGSSVLAGLLVLIPRRYWAGQNVVGQEAPDRSSSLPGHGDLLQGRLIS
jgi:hypothetical protein